MVPLVSLGLDDRAHLARDGRRCGRVAGRQDADSGDVLQRFVHVLPVLDVLVELAGFADRGQLLLHDRSVVTIVGGLQWCRRHRDLIRGSGGRPLR